MSPGAIRRSLGVGTALLVAGLLAACSYPTRNIEADSLDQRDGYRWTNLDGGELDDTLVVVTASGGGTRAAALAMATLRALQDVRLRSGGNLAEEVDVISSVSGGSVAAAYFAYKGTDGFAALEHDFIRTDGISALLWDGLNPVGLAELATPSKERIDLLIDHLDRTLFHDVTYEALLRRGRRPFLILNAADMVSGTVFPFTQYNLDLLCSDLRDIKLSMAVAASAAFPGALAPVTLRNHSPCAAQKERAWPPVWIQTATGTDYYTNADRLQRGRVALGYARGSEVPPPDGRRYVHLLDGGTADNLGISEPFRLLTTADVSPQFLNDVALGRIKRIVFVLVNARSQPASALNARATTPGVVDMLLGTVNTSIDNATFGNLDRLRTLLREGLRARAETAPEPVRKNLLDVAEQTYFLPVDFAAIDSAECRRAFQGIATSWDLDDREIDALLQVAAPLLAASPEFPAMLEAIDARFMPPPADLGAACRTVLEARRTG